MTKPAAILTTALFTATASATLAQDGEFRCNAMICVGKAAEICMDTAQDGHSDEGMVECLANERDAWDDWLNGAYQDARAYAEELDADDAELYPQYAVRADQVRDAQRLWIKYRDANCAMEGGRWGGSGGLVAENDCLMRMTAQRTFELRAYGEQQE